MAFDVSSRIKSDDDFKSTHENKTQNIVGNEG